MYAQYGHAQAQPTLIMHQGNDSNCDFIAVANGIHNIGGDGQSAYWFARSFIPQVPRDFKEVYHTYLGPNGSDQPFTIDNLGAAPEAFVGMYEALGYNAVFLASTPGIADRAFVHAIRDRLAANPYNTFVHLWTVPRPYNPHARAFYIPETGETSFFPYPYHEVAAMLSPDLQHFIFLDGLASHTYMLTLQQVAHQLHAFNRVIVVSSNNGTIEDHQRFQASQTGQPYVAHTLGGLFLTKARQSMGSAYTRWGRAIGQPFMTFDGMQTHIVLPGEYVHYMRSVGSQEVTFAPLGRRMADELLGADILPAERFVPHESPTLQSGIQQWVMLQFGSVEQFEQAFGKPLTTEFAISQHDMQAHVLHWFPHAVVDASTNEYFICVVTEHAMLAWHTTHGTFLVPLGQVYYKRL